MLHVLYIVRGFSPFHRPSPSHPATTVAIADIYTLGSWNNEMASLTHGVDWLQLHRGDCHLWFWLLGTITKGGTVLHTTPDLTGHGPVTNGWRMTGQ